MRPCREAIVLIMDYRMIDNDKLPKIIFFLECVNLLCKFGSFIFLDRDCATCCLILASSQRHHILFKMKNNWWAWAIYIYIIYQIHQQINLESDWKQEEVALLLLLLIQEAKKTWVWKKKNYILCLIWKCVSSVFYTRVTGCTFINTSLVKWYIRAAIYKFHE